MVVVRTVACVIMQLCSTTTGQGCYRWHEGADQAAPLFLFVCETSLHDRLAGCRPCPAGLTSS